MAKKQSTACPPIRVVASSSKMSLPRNVRISKADGTHYVVPFHPGVPMLLVGESECHSVDTDVAGGLMHELKLTDDQTFDLLETLTHTAAAERIALLEAEVADVRGEMKVLQNELDEARSAKKAKA